MNDKPMDLMDANELRTHLSDKMEEFTGVSDLEESNRRLAVLQEWKNETMSGTAFQLYRCKDCGKVSVSLGWLHGHIDAKHRGYTRLRIQIPFTKTSPGDFRRLMERTEILNVREYDVLEDDWRGKITNGGEHI